MIDHLVFAAPELGDGIAAIERRLGVRAAMGGKHPGGTHNALLSLANGAYLEIIAPDPEYAGPAFPHRWLDGLREPRLVGWAAKAPEIERRVADAAAAGHPIGSVSAASRQLPDGDVLHWSFTYPPPVSGDGIAPFLIRWEPGPHPSETSPSGCELLGLRGEHPEPERIQALLRAMAVELEVAEGPAPALIATIRCPNGLVELR
jgi:hypothetical protein